MADLKIKLEEMDRRLTSHFLEDLTFQSSQLEYHKKLEEKMDLIITIITPLRWLSDGSRAVGLLKKPSLWLVAFVIGLVALLGGLKALATMVAGWFIIVK